MVSSDRPPGAAVASLVAELAPEDPPPAPAPPAATQAPLRVELVAVLPNGRLSTGLPGLTFGQAPTDPELRRRLCQTLRWMHTALAERLPEATWFTQPSR